MRCEGRSIKHQHSHQSMQLCTTRGSADAVFKCQIISIFYPLGLVQIDVQDVFCNLLLLFRGRDISNACQNVWNFLFHALLEQDREILLLYSLYMQDIFHFLMLTIVMQRNLSEKQKVFNIIICHQTTQSSGFGSNM